MLGFRNNVSLEQQRPASADSGDSDLNYTITIQLVALWKSYSKEHDCCKSCTGQHFCRNAKVSVVHTMQQLQPELANVGREQPNNTKRIFCRSYISKQYYMELHRNARRQCEIFERCDHGAQHTTMNYLVIQQYEAYVNPQLIRNYYQAAARSCI